MGTLCAIPGCWVSPVWFESIRCAGLVIDVAVRADRLTRAPGLGARPRERTVGPLQGWLSWRRPVCSPPPLNLRLAEHRSLCSPPPLHLRPAEQRPLHVGPDCVGYRSVCRLMLLSPQGSPGQLPELLQRPRLLLVHLGLGPPTELTFSLRLLATRRWDSGAMSTCRCRRLAPGKGRRLEHLLPAGSQASRRRIQAI